ncbi:peptide deformylase [Shewanella litorisediminis]|uniref:Peptide deformylase n=1 Tax=Shewanella litorisediminis TaxID=1173586 RepID=A0ABX7G582_9GAMM|nr:peptide deformylase [Shewanella litorisediminis]MCL2917970.1 peptide deformylase [Shewanella litorisediminis]QRH02403.1 peptide deformylase [Shewanella litorisediminis]
MASIQTAPIAITGDPVLYQKAAPVIAFDVALHNLTQTLMATMLQARGVGIAAPQIGVSQRLFIVASRPNERYPDAPLMEPMVMVNPVLLSGSSEWELGEEGCLSVPGKRLSIARHLWIDAQWQDLQGNTHSGRLHGFVARIFQHELDHLDGITLIERITMASQEHAMAAGETPL